MDISVALGGGGSRGYAHIGVLRRLEQEGYKIKALAGTSAGGIIAAAYAVGLSVDELEERFAALDQTRLFARAAHDGPSILGLSGAVKELENVLAGCTFEDLRIPCALVAVDIKSGTEIIIREGLVLDAVLATIAVPGVFPPKIRGDMQLVDGAVLDPVPVSVARMLAPKLPVAAVVLHSLEREKVNVNPLMSIPLPMPVPVPVPIIERLTRTRIAQAFQIFLQSVDVGSRKIAEMRLEIDKPDVIIRPKVNRIGILDNVDVHEVVKIGEAAADEVLPYFKRITARPRWFRQVFPARQVEDGSRLT